MSPKKQEVFNCTHCDYTSVIPSNVRGHVTRVHKITNPKIHECHFCGEMFGNLHKLNFHMGDSYCANTNEDFARELEEKAEKRKSNFYCLECNYQSYLSYNVISHMINVHKITDPKIHGCKCGAMYRRASELKEHSLTCDQADPNFRGQPSPNRNPVQRRLHSKNRILGKRSHKKKINEKKISMANLVKIPVKGRNSVRNKALLKTKSKNTIRKSSTVAKEENTENPSSSKNLRKSAIKEKAEESESESESGDIEYFECSQCDYHSGFKSNLTAHMNLVHKAKVAQAHKCPRCKRIFRSSGKLKTHLRDENCKTTKIKNTMVGKRQARKPAKLDRLFHCLECEYQSPYTCHVRTHMKLKHNVSEPKIHQCEFCSEMFPTIIVLKKHMGDNFCVNTNAEFARKVREAEENKCYYNCLKCDYLSAYKHHIRNHMRVIHKMADPKFYSCESCGETFPKEGLVVAHAKSCSGQNAKDSRKKTKVPNEIYVCEKCGVAFDDKNHFEGHKEFTNCKKRRKTIRKGEIFGDSSLFPNIIVQKFTNDNCTPEEIASPVNNIKNSRILSGKIKITGKMARGGKNSGSLTRKKNQTRGKRVGKRSQIASRMKNTQQIPGIGQNQGTNRKSTLKTLFPVVKKDNLKLPMSSSTFLQEQLPLKCFVCAVVFENKGLLDCHLRQQHLIINHKWNADLGNRNSFDKGSNILMQQPESTEIPDFNEIVKLKVEEIDIPDDPEKDLHDAMNDSAKHENIFLDDKEIIESHQYLNAHSEGHLEESGFECASSSAVVGGESRIEIDEGIAIETTEVEGPSTDSENYYIFDNLSSTYITESQNFIVHEIDGTIYDGEVYAGMEIGEGFNIDPSSTATDNVFYQFQYCDGENVEDNVVLLEDSEFINSNINENDDLTLVEFVPNNNNVPTMDETDSTAGIVENQYQCKLCSFVCSNESGLEIHLEKHN